MRYILTSPDGSRSEPADIETLNAWIAEGRLVSDQVLEEEGTGRRVTAVNVMGLFLPHSVARVDDGSTELSIAWFGALISVVFCFVGIIGGVLALIFAKRAEDKGVPSAMAPRVIAIVGIALFLLFAYVFVLMQRPHFMDF